MQPTAQAVGVCRKADPAPEGAKETKGSLTAKFAKDAKKALNRRVRRGFAEHAEKWMNVLRPVNVLRPKTGPPQPRSGEI